jgi:hypothetical protein
MPEFKPGDAVRVKEPTGGVRRDDRFSVIPTPAGKSSDFVWISFDGEIESDRFFTDGQPMGFDPSSLVSADRVRKSTRIVITLEVVDDGGTDGIPVELVMTSGALRDNVLDVLGFERFQWAKVVSIGTREEG